jgi:hypothetical protein
MVILLSTSASLSKPETYTIKSVCCNNLCCDELSQGVRHCQTYSIYFNICGQGERYRSIKMLLYTRDVGLVISLSNAILNWKLSYLSKSPAPVAATSNYCFLRLCKCYLKVLTQVGSSFTHKSLDCRRSERHERQSLLHHRLKLQ